MIVVLAEAGSLASGGVIRLAPDEAHHLSVRRISPGVPVRVLDGEGAVAEGILIDRDRVEIAEYREVPRPAPLILAVGSGDRERFAWLAEKAAELAVTDLVPIESERVAGVSSRLRESHIPRLARRALEAIKQSGACWAPRVHAPVPLTEWLPALSVDRRWLGDVEGGSPSVLARDEALIVAVGPEGGWSPAERSLLLARGFQPVRLGAHTLRFETAALAAAVTAGLLREGASDHV